MFGVHVPVYSCLHVCGYLCVYVGAPAHLSECVWRPEVGMIYLLHSLFTLYTEAGELEAHSFGNMAGKFSLGSPVSTSYMVGLQVGCHTSQF